MKRKRADRTGEVHNYLTVEALHAIKHGNGNSIWRCRCRCGKTVIIVDSDFVSGRTKSCGCRGEANRLKAVTKHGAARYKSTNGGRVTKTYTCWLSMKQRCYDPKVRHFRRYGGRGITVCDRWLHSFANFLEDMGEQPPGMEIDRRDNDGIYEPQNCHWVTQKQQASNRSTSLRITYGGKTQCASEWASETGFGRQMISQRFHKGWTPHQILTTPRFQRRMAEAPQK